MVAVSLKKVFSRRRRHTRYQRQSRGLGDVYKRQERTLRRLFQESIGLSWRTYLLNARMLRAMALLTEPGQSVQATATAVGFESLSAFTRCFTQFSGRSPSGYRRQTAETARPPREAR